MLQAGVNGVANWFGYHHDPDRLLKIATQLDSLMQGPAAEMPIMRIELVPKTLANSPECVCVLTGLDVLSVLNSLHSLCHPL